MSEFDQKRWYAVTDRKSRNGIYRLTYQTSADRAVEVAGSSFTKPHPVLMSWRGLQALTECRIPHFAGIDGVADAPLIFNINKRTVVIYG